MPAMFFGDEHLGKAVAMLRQGADLDQKELAGKIGVKSNTMNQYENGRRGMSDEVIVKVAGALQRDPIEIWDMAYSIFRFNHFRERAEKEGLDVKELIARIDARPSLGVILELLDSAAALERQCRAEIFKFLDSLGRAGLGGLGLVEIVVRPHPNKPSKMRKALRFSRKERLKSSEPR